jgi:mRNA-degrading endonuclease RelE of RelBE toxin-antitoxin system
MLQIAPVAEKQLLALPRSIRGRMFDLIERLRNWPEVSGVKPLRGNLAGHYRLRTGDFRLQFHVADQDVIIEHIGHRDGFYD